MAKEYISKGAIRRILSERKGSLASANCVGILLALSLIENSIIEKHARGHTFPASYLPEREGLTILLV